MNHRQFAIFTGRKISWNKETTSRIILWWIWCLHRYFSNNDDNSLPCDYRNKYDNVHTVCNFLTFTHRHKTTSLYHVSEEHVSMHLRSILNAQDLHNAEKRRKISKIKQSSLYLKNEINLCQSSSIFFANGKLWNRCCKMAIPNYQKPPYLRTDADSCLTSDR